MRIRFLAAAGLVLTAMSATACSGGSSPGSATGESTSESATGGSAAGTSQAGPASTSTINVCSLMTAAHASSIVGVGPRPGRNSWARWRRTGAGRRYPSAASAARPPRTAPKSACRPAATSSTCTAATRAAPGPPIPGRSPSPRRSPASCTSSPHRFREDGGAQPLDLPSQPGRRGPGARGPDGRGAFEQAADLRAGAEAGRVQDEAGGLEPATCSTSSTRAMRSPRMTPRNAACQVAGRSPAQIISARRSEVTPDGSSARATSATCALRPPRLAPVTVPARPVTAGVPSISIRTH
jgi:hypothetical protein